MNYSEYLAHAAEAERLAHASQSAEERAAYERIAAVWRELAAAAGQGDVGEADEISAAPGAEATPQRATAKSQ